MTLAKLACAALLAMTLASPATAVDTSPTEEVPDLTAVRAKIKDKDFKSALAELTQMIDKGAEHADVYNLMGFSLRKTGDYPRALTFYQQSIGFRRRSQRRARVSGRALRRDRSAGEGERTPRHPGAAVPARVRGARGSRQGARRGGDESQLNSP